MGSRRRVLQGERARAWLHALELLLQMDGLRQDALQRVPHACGGVLRGEPRHDEQAAIAAHRELGEPRLRLVQRHMEVQHIGVQVLSVQPRAARRPQFPGNGTVRQVPGRAVASLIRLVVGMPHAWAAALPADRRRQVGVHSAGIYAGGFGLARNQELLRVRRARAAPH